MKETKEVGVVTDFNRKLLVSQDWFYSELYRNMLEAFYKRQGKSVPDEILIRFARHDKRGNYKSIEGPLKENNGIELGT